MSYPSGIQDPIDDFYMDGYGSANVAFSPTHIFTPRESGSTPFDADFVYDAQNHMTVNDPTHPPTKESLKAAMDNIVELFRLDEEDVGMDMGDEAEEPPIDYADQLQRTDRLRRIAPALDQLWWNDSEYMVGATEKLADGSRNPKWRIPINHSGLLNSYIRILSSEGVSQPLMIHVLRLIGNSCADTDENREMIVSQNVLPAIIKLLKDISLLPFVIPVLFNICIDYEPAQRQASQSFLSKALVELVASQAFHESRAFLGYICKLLDLLVLQPSEPENAPENTGVVLLNLAADREELHDLEDFTALVNTAIAYLQRIKFQEALIKHGGLESALKVLLFSYTRFEDTGPESMAQAQDDAAQLSTMRSNMNQVLSDVSALPEFATFCPVVSPFSSSLRRWLSSPQKQLQVCACIMLGNIARSDLSCEEFVHISRVHKPLINILHDTNDVQLLHATLGFLKNLALPQKNKNELGDAGLIFALERLWIMEAQPQIQYSSISLVRQLCIGTFLNVQRICKHLSPDPDSPAHKRSLLNIIISIFHKTTAEPIKMEIARLFTAIARVFTSPTEVVADADRRRKLFFEKHPDIGRPIAFMVSQKKWPVVRSEGWFVMALMCRTPEGARCISEIMHDMTVFQPLVELMTGKNLVNGQSLLTPSQTNSPASDHVSSPSGSMGSKEAEMQRIDRENALVLISELMKHCGAEMAPMRRSVFEELLKGGGTMHLSYQQVQAREQFFDSSRSTERVDLRIDDLFQGTTSEFMG